MDISEFLGKIIDRFADPLSFGPDVWTWFSSSGTAYCDISVQTSTEYLDGIQDVNFLGPGPRFAQSQKSQVRVLVGDFLGSVVRVIAIRIMGTSA